MKKRKNEEPSERKHKDLENTERSTPKRRMEKPVKHRKNRDDDDLDSDYRPHDERHTVHTKLRNLLKSSSDEDWDDYED